MELCEDLDEEEEEEKEESEEEMECEDAFKSESRRVGDDIVG